MVDLGFGKGLRAGRKIRSRIAIGAGVTLLAAALVWGISIRPVLIKGEQLRNAINLQTYAYWVEQYFKAHGLMPATLSEAVPEAMSQRALWLASRDAYDHPFHYEVTGEQFLIASYGRDGIRDEQPYARQGDDRSKIVAPCRDADIDTAYSSAGVFQACRK